jgi:hypothetical protein
LLPNEFPSMICFMAKENHYSPAMAWRVTVESWLHRQDLIAIHQIQTQKASTSFAEKRVS